jgi:hypothetical protein
MNRQQVAYLPWWGVQPEENDVVTCQFGTYGFYGEWVIEQMPKLIDLTNKTFNRFKVISRDTTKTGKYVYWICECKCGIIKSVRGKDLTSGSIKSCGCLNDENIHRKQRNSKDITNNRYGKLVAKYYIRSGKRGAIWFCECDCGNTCEAYVTDLTNKVKQSCNCLEYENQMKGIKMVRELITDNTNIGKIRSKTPYSNTTSGIRGVSWCTSKQKWIATIRFQGHVYYLGSSSDKKWCETLRKEAEEKIFGEFLEWYNKR